jgi:hypothetical protein
MPVTAASYVIKVRDNNLNLIGEIDAFDQFEMISRYNNVGSWTLTLADDHPMAPFLATPGYGIYVIRTPSGGSPAYYFSGPVRLIDRRGIASNSLTVAGYDDMFWVAAREAYPGGWNAYPQWLLFNNELRAYSFGDASGTTAVDFGIAGQNGTYTGTVTLGQATLVDDPATAVLLGSNGYVSVPSSGLPVNNQAFGMMVWFNYTGAPAATEVLGFLGTSGGASCAYMGILTTGKPTMQLKGVNTSSTGAALTVGNHMMFLDYDGTTGKLYVDGAVVATATPGVCTITYGNAEFGCYGAGVSNFSQCVIQYGVIYNGHLGNAPLPGSIQNGLPWQQVLYNLGLSLFNINQYDAESGAAETVIKTYVDRNLGPGAATVRQLANFTIQVDAAQGSTVTYNARFDQLLQMDMNGLLQILANAGGVGMKVIQSGTGLIFQVFVPSTNTVAKFSLDLGNLGAYEYIQDAQNLVNYVVVGGGGTGLARTFYQTSNAASIASWGRCEGFVNGGSSTVAAQLQNQATNALSNGASKLTFNAQFYETDGLQYVRDFNLGDKVSVVIDGATLTDIVREVDIVLDPNNGETLNIGIGTPSNGQIVGAIQKYQQMAQSIATRVTVLERV